MQRRPVVAWDSTDIRIARCVMEICEKKTGGEKGLPRDEDKGLMDRRGCGYLGIGVNGRMKW